MTKSQKGGKGVKSEREEEGRPSCKTGSSMVLSRLEVGPENGLQTRVKRRRARGVKRHWKRMDTVFLGVLSVKAVCVESITLSVNSHQREKKVCEKRGTDRTRLGGRTF